MKKTIAVVAMEMEYAEILCGNLSEYLSRYADFRYYSLEEIGAMDFIREDFVVITTFTIFEAIKRKMRSGSELIVVSLTLNKKGIRPLYELPKGTRALLVNFDYRACVQTITNLYGAGFSYLELVPYYGQREYDRGIGLAITPNEARLVPPGVQRVIDIGESVVDFNGLYHIAEALGVQEVFAANEGILAKKSGIFSNYGIERVLGENESLMQRVNTLLKLMKQGIVLTDVVGNIHTCNEKAQKLLQGRSSLLTGFNIGEILPELRRGRRRGSDVWLMEQKEELICVDGENLIAAVTAIETDGVIHGYIVTLDDFEEIEEKQHGMRSKLSKVEHVARYHFEDIRGSSGALREAVVAARRMARSDASILIVGESGTGKEVFAQSIHNESARARYNFVAVNCAAIPENLLESEMFGYEEGSFTGARKGGKIGYFELAHRGTIFLDEIAELPLLLQSKLLRVIEEREIIKIGSQKVVSVDVRIIAATNRNLYKMVEEGTFREDLYYRLNVLPLRIPPLRERKGDLQELLVHFMKQQGCPMTFTPEAREALQRYHWRGNIRELRNVVEYLSSLEKVEIAPEDLPRFEGMTAQGDPDGISDRPVSSSHGVPYGPQTQEKGAGDAAAAAAGTVPQMVPEEEKESVGELTRRFLLREGKSLELYRFLLEELLAAKGRRQRPGRLHLLRRAEETGVFYSEAEIRRGLARLGEYGLVRTGSGRSGSVITAEGEELLRGIRRFLG
ncbi:sigma-54 interaction domain-containing protein [Bacilliculturomica massiliensis]|uniref:sigma-54 interaction domain-containing protein n=1 Tax=Bacilliculturomica massiliensis TaxID=1917867 RepID=UPI00102F30AB|nr:sigma 54-interacting transcriptional regulator [Bacilliculturomica massiliensis]